MARYLRDNPGFFESHAELLAAITVPHPHGGRAISLQERQLEVLREKLRARLKLAELLRIGQENDAIGEKRNAGPASCCWSPIRRSCPTSSSTDCGPCSRCRRSRCGFGGCEGTPRPRVRAAVPVDVITLANSMAQPFCGPNNAFQAAAWLPDGGADTRSIALLPLRKGVDPNAFGLVVLGSADPDRFRSGMGTAFLSGSPKPPARRCRGWPNGAVADAVAGDAIARYLERCVANAAARRARWPAIGSTFGPSPNWRCAKTPGRRRRPNPTGLQ